MATKLLATNIISNIFLTNHSGEFFGRTFVKRFALSYRTVVCLSSPVCDVGVLWPNGWMDQNETRNAGRPRPRPHCVTWGPSSPSPIPKEAQPPIFGPCLLWPNGRPSQLLLSSCSFLELFYCSLLYSGRRLIKIHTVSSSTHINAVHCILSISQYN